MTTDTDRPLETLLRGAEHTETNFRFAIPPDDAMIRRHTALCATAIREAQSALQRVILISELPAAIRKAIDFLTGATIEAEHVEAMLRQKDMAPKERIDSKSNGLGERWMPNIEKNTAMDIALSYREIEVAEEILSSISESIARHESPDIRDAFGRRQGGLTLGVPAGNQSQRLFDVPWALAMPVIKAHIAHHRARIEALTEQAITEARGID